MPNKASDLVIIIGNPTTLINPFPVTLNNNFKKHHNQRKCSALYNIKKKIEASKLRSNKPNPKL